MILMVSLAGCTGLSPTTPNAEISSDVNEINVGDVINFDGRDSTSPSPTIIVDYNWNFGDGETRLTKSGIISHYFQNPGSHEVELTVTNDYGESDSISMTIFVNSPPSIIIEAPSYVKTGEIATLDATNSFDPEGGNLEFIWDFDKSIDSDGDGDPAGDADSIEPIAEIEFLEAGNQTGVLTIVDDMGGISSQEWTIMVISRTYYVYWEEEKIIYSWSDYLEQGESISLTHEPGLNSRIIEFNASLILDRELIPLLWPEDNFSLHVNLPMTGWETSASTTHDNITENASAYISYDELNDIPENDYNIQGDSAENIIFSLLNEPGQRWGMGEWIWTITADQCDPDLPVDGIDPDTGNDWSLEIELIILTPRVAEIGI
jgi:PKD repeat protein